MTECITFHFILNHERFETANPHPTGKEILVIAGIDQPECYSLYLLTHCGKELVGLDEKVDLSKPGRERFAAILDKPKNGRAETLRRDFALDARTEAMLDDLGLEVETIQDGRSRWAVTPPVVLPDAFAQEAARLAFPVPENPEAAFDMFWASPSLSMKSGRVIEQATMQPCVSGEQWQRWSRHYVAPWNPKRCNLATHLMAVLSWLDAEAKRG